jgi:lysophospholipid hydrolase
MSLTLPVISYFSGRSFNEALIDCFGTTQIEDLWLRYFCVSTNVSEDTVAVHTTGPLWKYCRASMTVMGLLPPLYDNGRLLIDGGYVNNLPVEILRSLAPQVNQAICVDVENKDNSPFEGIDDFGTELSGWWVAYKYILSMLRLSKPLKIPPLSEIALKVSYVSHSMMIREVLARADDSIIYIRPDVGTRFKLLDYHLMPTIVSVGIEEAQEVLNRWEHRQRRRIARELRRASRQQAEASHGMQHAARLARATLAVPIPGPGTVTGALAMAARGQTAATTANIISLVPAPPLRSMPSDGVVPSADTTGATASKQGPASDKGEAAFTIGGEAE